MNYSIVRISPRGWQVFRIKVNRRLFDGLKEFRIPIYEPVSGIHHTESAAVWDLHRCLKLEEEKA